MIKVRVGGVPEHFNYPWHYGISRGIFSKNNIEVEWIDVKGGSGAMCKMLDEGELDIALVLTEGIIKHIHKGSSARIIQQYVKSPLTWGVHSVVDSTLSENDLSEARFARSRVGSGSHLMAHVHAEQKEYTITEKNFVTVGSIDGAMKAFEEDTADILLWEKFMTQPYVDQKKVSRIGHCISPWPCFMMVGSGAFLSKSKSNNAIQGVGESIVAACKEVSENKGTIQEIAEDYYLDYGQVEQWYSSLEWQTSEWVSQKMLQNVIDTLSRINLLTEALPPSMLCYDGVKLY